MADSVNVLIVAETAEGGLAPITAELLGGGSKLAAGLGGTLGAVIMGNDVDSAAQSCIALGAQRVYAVNDPLLEHFQSDAYTAALEKVVKDVQPQIVLVGQTAAGRDLGPRLAFRLGVGIASDCLNLDINDNKELVAVRPAYGGNAWANVVPQGRPQVASVRVKTQVAAEPDAARSGEVVSVASGLSADAVKTHFVEKVSTAAEGPRLEDAAIIVTGGRGVGGPDAFKELEELAKMLGGAVGASKAAVDSGWAPPTHQVGLTGKMVSPDMYIAVGVSGAVQHMAGCSGSKLIIAINKDPEADIFKYARYGVVGDWKQAFPAFKDKIKELLGK